MISPAQQGEITPAQQGEATMRTGGIHWLAVIAAAIAIYVIGFVIYGVLVSEQTMMAMTGMTESEKAIAMSRLTFSPLMPILTAVFMAILFKWGSVDSAAKGVKWAVVLAMASAVFAPATARHCGCSSA